LAIVRSLQPGDSSLAHAMKAEGKLVASVLQAIIDDARAKRLGRTTGWDWVHEMGSDLVLACFYKPNQTANLSSSWYESLANVMNRPAHELQAAFEGVRMKQKERMGMNLFGLFYPNNPVGKILVNVGTNDFSKYAYRLHDLEGYLRLVQTKMWLMNEAGQPQALPVAQLLKGSPQAMRNPYTLQPMSWDERQSELVFEGREVATFNPTKTTQFITRINTAEIRR
jgi:hypothetical protein